MPRVGIRELILSLLSLFLLLLEINIPLFLFEKSLIRFMLLPDEVKLDLVVVMWKDLANLWRGMVMYGLRRQQAFVKVKAGAKANAKVEANVDANLDLKVKAATKAMI